MVSSLESYQQRCGTPWLQVHGAVSGHSSGHVSGKFEATFERRYRQLTAEAVPPAVMLSERRPEVFLASFLAACAAECPLFLANPRWTDSEWRTAIAIAQPTLVWRDGATTSTPQLVPSLPSGKRPESAHRPARNRRWIMIPTGGTSGALKFSIHTWETLSASVQGFRQYFDCQTVNACCTLPLYHVSGLMQFMRCWLSGGQLVIRPWRSLTQPAPAPEPFFLSLVPSQLQQLLSSPDAIALRRFRAILLGGAPAWPSLLDRGRSLQLPLAPTYGMTETASQVATLKPEDFLAGRTGCGSALPHAQIKIVDAYGSPTEGRGQVAIVAQSLHLGYYPQASYPAQLETDDLGYLEAGVLHLTGRRSDAIISGGENIFPAEVEAAIRATGLVEDVAVIGVEDGHWGETPVALYVPSKASSPAAPGEAAPSEPNGLETALSQCLSRYKHPSRWIALPELPRSAQGKLDRRALRAIASGKA